MKLNLSIKIIIVLLLTLTFIAPAWALLRGFSPDSYPSTKTFGLGAYFSPKEVTIYAEPKLDSQVLEKLEWQFARVQIDSLTGNIASPADVFITFYPYKEIAMMAVKDEVDGWVKVIYNQRDKSEGWVPLETPAEKTQYNNLVGSFYTWYDFMFKIAKRRGVYFLPGVPKKLRKLRGQPSDDANIVRYNFTYVRSLDIKVIRGNWMLVKIVDLEEGSPIGWIRWRDEDGQLLVFCNMD
ncbi:MAG: hypothetical protein AB1782_18205 [Cyanobacteriota bacterium]